MPRRLSSTRSMIGLAHYAMSIAILAALGAPTWVLAQAPVERLTTAPLASGVSTDVVLPGEVEGVTTTFVRLSRAAFQDEHASDDCEQIFLILQGQGELAWNGESHPVVAESILHAPAGRSIRFSAAGDSHLHYLRIDKRLSEADLADRHNYSEESRTRLYHKRFVDCRPYTEAIKSPKTISRTLLPEGYVPRVAIGTVQTTGPDAVGAHEHPMLDQLFLGLTGNHITVTADGVDTELPELTLLHIPLGSMHGVTVADGRQLHYVWMDFFIDKSGQEWLKTHKHLDE